MRNKDEWIVISGFGRSFEDKSKKTVDEYVEEDVLLRFDSGERRITFKDAAHHLITLGTTGSGKSMSVIFPCLMSLFSIGATGLIIDVKGNLRSKVRAIAKKLGREKDIIELGTAPSAQKINILKDLTAHGLRIFFEEIVMSHCGGDHTNSDWTKRGIMQTGDCAVLLSFLAKEYPEFTPTVRLVLDMIENPPEAAKLFKLFKQKIYDPNNMEQRRFVSTVENNEFHPLKEQSDNGSSRTSSDEQQTWNLNMSRDGLRAFLATPGIEENFCFADGPGVDLYPYLAAGKIVILRFELDTGPVGNKLARMVMSHFYQTVFEMGQQKRQERKLFICVDEFQEVADLSDGRFSDTSFIAQAREFNCAFIAATQSMSALICKGQASTAVEAFIANCNQRILFYSDDPVTQEMAKRYDANINLSELEGGEAFVVSYNQAKRRHEHGVETLQEAYLSTKELTDNAEENYARPSLANSQPSISLFSLYDKLKYLPNPQKSESSAQSKKTKTTALVNKELDMQGNEFYDEFRDFFSPDLDPASFNLPNGWLVPVRKAFRLFAQTGMNIQISRFKLRNGYLYVETEESNHHSSSQDLRTDILNSLLQTTYLPSRCVICGESTVSQKEAPQSTNKRRRSEYDDDEDISPKYRQIEERKFVCEKCQKRLNDKLPEVK